MPPIALPTSSATRTVVYWATTALVAAEMALGELDAGTLVFLVVLTGLTAASWALRPPARRVGAWATS